MKIFHIALRDDWEAATRAGEYRMSTRGRTLEDEGFIHAAQREQVHDVWREFYADEKAPLVLLSIDTGRLTAEVREERVGERVFPHIYGPINRAAVVGVQTLDRRGIPVSFMQLVLRDMAWRMAAAIVIMGIVGVLTKLGASSATPNLAYAGLVVGLLLGIPVWRLFARRFG